MIPPLTCVGESPSLMEGLLRFTSQKFVNRLIIARLLVRARGSSGVHSVGHLGRSHVSMTKLVSPRAKRAQAQQGSERRATPVPHSGREANTPRPGRVHRTPPPVTEALSRAQKQELDWLRGSLFQIETVMDSIAEDIYFKDRNGRFTRVNRALANHLGLSDPARAIGRNEMDFLCRDEAEHRCRDDRGDRASRAHSGRRRGKVAPARPAVSAGSPPPRFRCATRPA